MFVKWRFKLPVCLVKSSIHDGSRTVRLSVLYMTGVVLLGFRVLYMTGVVLLR